METKHIVKSFDKDLQSLDNSIAEMGGLVEMQLARTLECLVKRDVDLALDVTAKDRQIDDMETKIHMDAVRLLGLRQPIASDLREVIAAFQTASELERIGDYARNIAKRTTALIKLPPVGSAAQSISRMGSVVQGMVKGILDAYQTRDTSLADDIRKRDREVDQLNTSLFRELLTYMMEDPHIITTCTHLLFISKNVERMGDHATNIAEHIHMIVFGHDPESERPKEDQSSFTVVEVPTGAPDPS